jgi:hypothetical protein
MTYAGQLWFLFCLGRQITSSAFISVFNLFWSQPPSKKYSLHGSQLSYLDTQLKSFTKQYLPLLHDAFWTTLLYSIAL